MRSYKAALLATSVSLFAACASASKGVPAAAASASAPAAAATSNSATISADDIAKANVVTAYDAVDHLHRRWFHDISTSSSSDVVIYLNNVKLDGGANALREIPAQDVVRIDYLKSNDAISRFGQEASGGAILVTRK